MTKWKIWHEGNMYRIWKICRTAGIGTLDGFEWGRNKVHSHQTVSSGEMIWLEIFEKGKIRARNQTETVGQIIRDFEKDSRLQKILKASTGIERIFIRPYIESGLRICRKFQKVWMNTIIQMADMTFEMDVKSSYDNLTNNISS